MKEQLQEDIKSAMKAREQERVATLRGLMSEIKRVEIDEKKDVDEAGFVALVRKEIKKRRDAISFAEQGGREDLITQNKSEIAMLEVYLGDQLSEDDLRKIIGGIVDGGAANIGQVMGALNKDHKGKFDGRTASEIVKELLG